MFELPVESRLSRRRTVRAGLMVAVCIAAMSLPFRADTAPGAAQGTPPASASHWAEQVVLGSSTVELTGPWKFHKGDNLDWAQPDFNDSGWSAMDLTPPQGSYDPFLGTSGFVPGWTVLGDAGYSGYAWYRLNANVQYDPGLTPGGLALKMPDDVDDAYQVYVNGQPVLGQAAPIDRMLRLDWDAVNHSQISRFLEVALLLLAITVTGVLFWLDRKEKAYLWLGLTCGAILIQTLAVLFGNYTSWIPGAPQLLLTDAVLSPAMIGLWIIFWAYWFRMGHMARLHRMVWGFAGLLALNMAMLRAPLYGNLIPVQAVMLLAPLSGVLKLLLGALLVWIAWEGMRKDHAGAWLAMPAVGLVTLSLYQQELLVLHVPRTFFPFGFSVSIAQIAVVVSLNIIN